jgi:hypothetical protein
VAFIQTNNPHLSHSHVYPESESEKPIGTLRSSVTGKVTNIFFQQLQKPTTI